MRIIGLRHRLPLLEESVTDLMEKISEMIGNQSEERGLEETRAAAACVSDLEEKVRSYLEINGCLRGLRIPIVAKPEISVLIAGCFLSRSSSEGKPPYIARRDTPSKDMSVRFYPTNHPKIFLEELRSIITTNGVAYSLVGQHHVRIWKEELAA